MHSFLLYVFLGVACLPIFFKLNPTDKMFWLTLIITLPFIIYFIIIKPNTESKTYITKIEMKENLTELHLDLLIFNTKKHIILQLKDLKYNLFNQVKSGLTDRIILYEKNDEVLIQYVNTRWNSDEIKKVTEVFSRAGIEKPFGFNK